MPPPPLEKKIALVTGAGRGIGRAIAEKLACAGARVVVNDLDEEPTREVVDAINGRGGEAIACAGSVIDPAFGERFVDAALKAWGDIHIIVNNAGYTWDSVIQKMTDEQWDAIIDVHLKAPFRILRAAAEPIRLLVKKERATGQSVTRKVVNISSISGTMGAAGQANYSSAKAGITGLTKTLAKEWGRYQVTVNCVAFAFIHTRSTVALTAESTIQVDGRTLNVGIQPVTIDYIEKATPLGRGGTPEEAAGAVYLFCIPESDYISGQTIVCGGGFGSVS